MFFFFLKKKPTCTTVKHEIRIYGRTSRSRIFYWRVALFERHGRTNLQNVNVTDPGRGKGRQQSIPEFVPVRNTDTVAHVLGSYRTGRVIVASVNRVGPIPMQSK